MLKRSSSALSTAKITILALAGIYFIGVTMESHSLTLDEACAFLKISNNQPCAGFFLREFAEVMRCT